MCIHDAYTRVLGDEVKEKFSNEGNSGMKRGYFCTDKNLSASTNVQNQYSKSRTELLTLHFQCKIHN